MSRAPKDTVRGFGRRDRCVPHWLRLPSRLLRSRDPPRADAGGLLDAADDVSTVVVDRHGSPLYEARSTGGLATVRVSTPRPSRDRWSTPRLPPKIAASAVIRASIRSRWFAPLVRNVRAGAVR